MRHLRHQSSATDTWAYDSPSRTITARFSTGVLQIPVCTEKHPRHAAFFLSRKSEEHWTIAPVWCLATPHGFAARNCAFDTDGVHCEFIYLVGADEATNAAMSQLYEDPLVATLIEDDAPTVKFCPKCNAKGTSEDGTICALCEGKCVVSFEDALAWERLTK